jgi:hypothetical protein
MFRRIVQWMAFGIVIAAGAAAGHVGFDSVDGWLSDSTPVDRALADIQGSPLLGPVIKEFPEAQAKLRTAIAQDLRNPPKNAPSQTFLASLEIRRAYIVPALRRASDEAILTVSAAQADLVKRLRVSNLPTCRAFLLTGIEHPDRLGRDERQSFDRLLKVTEQAYLSGRSGARPSDSIIGDERAAQLLKVVGFNLSDFKRIQQLSSLGAADVCGYGLRLTQAPASMRPVLNADLARYLVTR